MTEVAIDQLLTVSLVLDEDQPLCSSAKVETESVRPQSHSANGGEGWRLGPLLFLMLSCA